MNVVEYDLSADPKLADQAEKVAREKALEKEKKKDEETDKDKESGRGGEGESGGQKAKDAKPATAAAPPAAPADEDADEDEAGADKPEEKPEAAAPAKPLDADLYEKLADPLRAKRERFLPPGKYSIEIVQGITVEKTTLVVKAEPERPGFGGDEAAPDRE